MIKSAYSFEVLLTFRRESKWRSFKKKKSKAIERFCRVPHLVFNPVIAKQIRFLRCNYGRAELVQVFCIQLKPYGSGTVTERSVFSVFCLQN